MMIPMRMRHWDHSQCLARVPMHPLVQKLENRLGTEIPIGSHSQAPGGDPKPGYLRGKLGRFLSRGKGTLEEQEPLKQG